MNVGVSTMDKWVRLLKDERACKFPKVMPMTPKQLEIRELKQIQRIEWMSDSLKNSR